MEKNPVDALVLERPRRADVRRQKILDCARTLFVEHGFHATGVAQISALSGVAVAQLYRDFADKEDIVAAIVRADSRKFMAVESLQQAIDGCDSAAVRDWLHHFVYPKEPGDEDGGRLLAEIIAESSRNERIAAIFAAIWDDIRGKILDALDMFSLSRSKPEAKELLADMIPTLSLGLMHHRLVHPDLAIDALAASFERIIDREIDALSSGIA